jgi:16S rRNA (cytidine1402-2'-O)-methyltransferase
MTPSDPRPERQPEPLPKGTLVLVGTPIGNLGDLSRRMVDALAGCDLIAAEDTRRTRQLLTYLGLHRPLTSYHEHNQTEKGSELLDFLRQGQTIALVSDAGMPCISDPGALLVSQCVEAGLPVLVIPGPSAAITALAGSGLETDRFAFEGFLPADARDRRKHLAELLNEPRTLVFYEAPHRLKKLLKALADAGYAERCLSLGRELTKLHEEFLRGTVASLRDFHEQNDPRGEYVVVLEGQAAFARRLPQTPGLSNGLDGEAAAETPLARAEALLRTALADGMPVKQAVRQVSQQCSLKKNELYDLALQLKSQNSQSGGNSL